MNTFVSLGVDIHIIIPVDWLGSQTLPRGKIKTSYVFFFYGFWNCNVTDLSHPFLLCVPEQGLCLCFLKYSRLVASADRAFLARYYWCFIRQGKQRWGKKCIMWDLSSIFFLQNKISPLLLMKVVNIKNTWV